MGLFDMFKKKAEPAAAAAPASISASAGADVLCSPVKGKVIKTVPEDQIVDTLPTCPIPSLVARSWARAVPCGPRTIWSTLPATAR